MEKRKIGPLTLGGFNVLVLEDLSLVIPPTDAANGDGEGRSTPDARYAISSAKDIARYSGLSLAQVKKLQAAMA